jgi:hypothetical protein
MKIEILGTPFNGLGTAPNIENPADGLRKLAERLLFHRLIFKLVAAWLCVILGIMNLCCLTHQRAFSRQILKVMKLGTQIQPEIMFFRKKKNDVVVRS